MKSIEDIESLSAQELETIAEDAAIEVPKTLMQTSQDTVLAAALKKSTARRTAGITFGVSLSAIAAASAAVLMIGNASVPKDTFDDPAAAYAELEKTFGYISQKMQTGLEIAQEAEPAITKTIKAIE